MWNMKIGKWETEEAVAALAFFMAYYICSISSAVNPIAAEISFLSMPLFFIALVQDTFAKTQCIGNLHLNDELPAAMVFCLNVNYCCFPVSELR